MVTLLDYWGMYTCFKVCGALFVHVYNCIYRLYINKYTHFICFLHFYLCMCAKVSKHICTYMCTYLFKKHGSFQMWVDIPCIWKVWGLKIGVLIGRAQKRVPIARCESNPHFSSHGSLASVQLNVSIFVSSHWLLAPKIGTAICLFLF